jgi:hypothetical protein
MRWALRRGGWILATAWVGAISACDDANVSVDPPPFPTTGGTFVGSGGTSFAGTIGIPLPVPGESPTAACRGSLPAMPLVRLSAADIDGALDAFFPPGPRLVDAMTVPDDGYERDLSLSFVRALRDVARERVKPVAADAASLAPCPEGDDDGDDCLQRWLREWGGKLYRRPLEGAQLAAYVTQFEAVRERESAEQAAIVTLSSMLVSPYFSLRIELSEQGGPGRISPYDVAARLSHFAMRRPPDAELVARAAAGQLSTPGELLQQLYRLWSLPEGRAARERQVMEWLGVSEPSARPELDAELSADMDRQLRSLISDVLDHQNGTLLALLTSSKQIVTQRLAVHYGLSPERTRADELVDWADSPYAGVLSTGSFLTRYPRPTPRGKQILDRFFCEELQHPFGADSTLADGATPRERITRSVAADRSCSGCHQIVDGLGLALDAFDDLGRLTGFATYGTVAPQLGAAGTPVDGPRSLGEAIANSWGTSSCVTKRYLEYALDTALASTSQIRIVAPQPEPVQDWTSCLATALATRGGSLTQLSEVIVTSSLMLETSNGARFAVAASTNLDPLSHAYDEGQRLYEGLVGSSDQGTMSRYLFALQDLLRTEQMPPDPNAGGAGGEATGGGGETGGASGETTAGGTGAGDGGGTP